MRNAMTLRAVLPAQEHLKAHGTARRPAHGPFASPALVRTALADLLAHTLAFVNALAGVFCAQEASDALSNRDSPYWTPGPEELFSLNVHRALCERRADWASGPYATDAR